MLSRVWFAFGRLGQELARVMAAGLGTGEGGDEGRPGRVGEDALGLGGDGVADRGLEAIGVLLAGCAAGELGQDGSGVLLVAGLEVVESLFGCGCLLFVAALGVPVGGGSGQVEGGEEHGDGEAAWACEA